jgi:hypothetical protein
MESRIMSGSDFRPGPVQISRLKSSGDLIIWRGSGIALVGENDGDRWIIARGWLAADQMTDIRRWVFSTPEAFCGQFRRLVTEASGNSDDGRAAGAAATEWASTRTALTTA